MDELTLDVIATSAKEDARRPPIRPRRLERVDPELRGRKFSAHVYPHRMHP